MLSTVFRAKMRSALTRAGLADLDPTVWQRRWTVHVKAIGRGDHAALYLARYVYRVALTNHRIERFTNGRVTFRYTHARSGETRRLTLPVQGFLARFLQHILPRGFTKVRSYGLLTPTRRRDLDRARALLQLHAATIAPASDETKPAEHNSGTTDLEKPLALCCPACGGAHLRLVERSPRSRAPPLQPCPA